MIASSMRPAASRAFARSACGPPRSGWLLATCVSSADRLLVLPVRGQRDAEARDRVEILTARGPDHPPQAVDRAGRVARALEQRGEPAVRIRMIGIARRGSRPSDWRPRRKGPAVRWRRPPARANHYCEDARAAPASRDCSAFSSLPDARNKRTSSTVASTRCGNRSCVRRSTCSASATKPANASSAATSTMVSKLSLSYFRDCSNARRPVSSSPRSSAATASARVSSRDRAASIRPRCLIRLRVSRSTRRSFSTELTPS